MIDPDSSLVEEIPLQFNPRKPGKEIQEWIEVCDREIERFYEEGLGVRYRNYVPCDPLLVLAGIEELIESGELSPGLFCEWGSGFGMASGIATLLGFEAIGIEKEEILVSRSSDLVREHGLDVTILEASYFPPGFEETEGIGGKDLLLPNEAVSGFAESEVPVYEELDPREVDLFFVYPWPDQEQMMMDLFQAIASEEAILMMYLGDGEMVAYRLNPS